MREGAKPPLNSLSISGDKESLREASPLFYRIFPPHARNIYPYHGEGDKPFLEG